MRHGYTTKTSAFQNLRPKTELQFGHSLAESLQEASNLSETQFPHL